MLGVTKELDILKQLFDNLSDTDKQAFLTSVRSKEKVKKVIEPRKITMVRKKILKFGKNIFIA